MTNLRSGVLAPDMDAPAGKIPKACSSSCFATDRSRGFPALRGRHRVERLDGYVINAGATGERGAA
jgi:hypothetical protein